jgi:hypothetical protein
MYVHMIVSGFGCPANRCMHSSTKTKRMGTFPENWLFQNTEVGVPFRNHRSEAQLAVLVQALLPKSFCRRHTI